MIDQMTFATWMGVFSDKFGRPLAQPTLTVMRSILDAELTTDEFVAGCAVVLRNSKFWPSPKEIIDAAKPSTDPKLEASDVWGDILRWNGREHLMLEARARLDDIGMRAFLAVGGPAKFRSLLESEAPFVKKEFIEAYTAAKRDAEEVERVERIAKVLAMPKNRVNAPTAVPPKRQIVSGPQSLGEIMPAALPPKPAA